MCCNFRYSLIARTARIACADRQTYTHTHKTTTVTLAAHACRGLIRAKYINVTEMNSLVHEGNVRIYIL